MNCPKCGNELKKGVKFCAKCGCNVEEFIKEQKQQKKEIRSNKTYKVKKIILLILILILAFTVSLLIGINVLGKKSHEPKEDYNVEENNVEEASSQEHQVQGLPEIEFKLTEENKNIDVDKDGLTNEEEVKYGTNVMSSDTDGDGLSDYDEVKRHESDPTKYSTSEDNISDYIKVERKLDIKKKYKDSEVKPEEVKYSYSIVLKPDDLESQYYGGLEEFNNDDTVKSTKKVFNMLDFKGKVEYDTGNKDSILLVRRGKTYYEFSNYKNNDGKLTIDISEEDNNIDFVITTKENFENYKKGE